MEFVKNVLKNTLIKENLKKVLQIEKNKYNIQVLNKYNKNFNLVI